MKVYNLTKNHSTYTSNAYFVRGEWNTLSDRNTLIDVGRDPILFSELDKIYTGVGKTRVEQVLLTHHHYDHTGNLKEIYERWKPDIYAFSKSINFPLTNINDGDKIKIGEQEAIVITCPLHSTDSVCYYVPEEKVLFSGDNHFLNKSAMSDLENYYEYMEKIANLDIKIIYPGHGDPIVSDCNKKIREIFYISDKERIIR